MPTVSSGTSEVITATDVDKQSRLPPSLAEMSEIQESVRASQAVLKEARKFFATKAAAVRAAKAAEPKAKPKAAAKRSAKK